MHKRNIAVSIILSFVTCGIYTIYWYIVLTDEMNAASEQREATSGGLVFLFTLLTCGIYGYFWAYKMGETVDMVKRNRGVQSSNTSIVYLLLNIFGFGIVTYALLQNELNAIYDYHNPYNGGPNNYQY